MKYMPAVVHLASLEECKDTWSPTSFVALSVFCLIQCLSTGLYQESIDTRQSLDWSTAIRSGSMELSPFMK